jgi:predicted lipoprotein with Yx(FWY)xxD motif
VSVLHDAKLGDHLVGPDGHSLYLFEKDTGTTTACTGACATAWPALASMSLSAGSGVDATKLSSANGQVPNQVVYNGHLLYYFAKDKAPGDLNGVGLPSWYAVSPAGTAIESD